ncbi:hypothetical protein OIU85_014400 [Salix viminalis]|uniref:Uncharacterized protein n=1 Tax=Salix viminalis TaxID=40686 RepID=A0A9Q0NII9_SALVM|nr:hypothetical protein OIU85_014400 [Salix viminalis]
MGNGCSLTMIAGWGTYGPISLPPSQLSRNRSRSALVEASGIRGIHSGPSMGEASWDRKATNHLHGLLWYPGHLPRQSFILRLATQNRLHTLNRLARMGHGRQKLQVVQQRSGNARPLLPMPIRKNSFGHNFDAGADSMASNAMDTASSLGKHCLRRQCIANNHIAKTILVVTIYYFWYERTDRTFKKVHRSSQELSNVILQLIQAHLMNTDIEDLVTDRIQTIWNL